VNSATALATDVDINATFDAENVGMFWLSLPNRTPGRVPTMKKSPDIEGQ
jgi:hypothetical protein